MTVYIKVDNTNSIIFTHYAPFSHEHGLNKTEEELLREGYLVEWVEPIEQEGMLPIAKYNKNTNTMYYDYIDATPFFNSEQRIEQLEKRLVAQQEQFQIELAESNTQMFELIMMMQGGIE